MINVDIDTGKFEMSGDVHDMAQEIVMALGTLCEEYKTRTGEHITPYQFIDLGVMILRDKESK